MSNGLTANISVSTNQNDKRDEEQTASSSGEKGNNLKSESQTHTEYGMIIGVSPQDDCPRTYYWQCLPALKMMNRTGNKQLLVALLVQGERVAGWKTRPIRNMVR